MKTHILQTDCAGITLCGKHWKTFPLLPVHPSNVLKHKPTHPAFPELKGWCKVCKILYNSNTPNPKLQLK